MWLTIDNPWCLFVLNTEKYELMLGICGRRTLLAVLLFPSNILMVVSVEFHRQISLSNDQIFVFRFFQKFCFAKYFSYLTWRISYVFLLTPSFNLDVTFRNFIWHESFITFETRTEFGRNNRLERERYAKMCKITLTNQHFPHRFAL